MTTIVSVSDFRKKLAFYLTQISQGTKIIIKDDKKNIEYAELTKPRKFDKEAYEVAIRKAAGTFTAERHPEWSTKKDVEKWLRETRLQSDRRFDW